MRKFLLPIVTTILFLTFSSCYLEEELTDTVDCGVAIIELSTLLTYIDDWDCENATTAYDILNENKDCEEMKALIEEYYGSVNKALTEIKAKREGLCY